MEQAFPPFFTPYPSGVPLGLLGPTFQTVCLSIALVLVTLLSSQPPRAGAAAELFCLQRLQHPYLAHGAAA